MDQLVKSLQLFLGAGWEVLVSVLAIVVPWTPLIIWVAFWLLAVNWEKLYPVLAKGGIVGVFLIGLMMVLIWGLIAPPAEGYHQLFGLKPSNFVGKTVYVTMLLTIMALCGSVQLSGACGSLVCFPEKPDDDDHHHGDSDHGGHGHEDHGDHGHGSLVPVHVGHDHSH